MDALSSRYLEGLLRLLGILAAIAAPFVLWAMVRYRRAGPAVETAAVKLPGGAYRGGSARPLRGRALPWTAYAALLASGMGALFVAIVVGAALWNGAPRTLVTTASALDILGALGCIVSRFALFFAALAVFRRRPNAAARARFAVLLTVCSLLPFGASVLLERMQMPNWRLELLDAALYAGGLVVTALLVRAAERAMDRLFAGSGPVSEKSADKEPRASTAAPAGRPR